MVDFPFKSSLS